MILSGTMQINSKQHLEIGGCDTVALAEEFGTPLFIMDEEQMRKNCRRYLQAMQENYPRGKIIYAGKAFLVLAMASLIKEEGLGLDVVSGGELYTALKAGFPPEHIFFHGNNKSRTELSEALKAKVGTIIVDSLSELKELLELSRGREQKVPIYLRIKPGIDTHTHDYIQTGQDDSKFGLGFSKAIGAVRLVLSAAPYLDLKGFHCHIGSQIFQLEPFRLAARAMVGFMAEVRSETGYVAPELDLGGGLGIRYLKNDDPPSIEKFVQVITAAVKETAKREDFPLPKLLLEPGRSISGEAGITLYRVGVIKDIPGGRSFASIDGGMTDNIRPALYQAGYEAMVANKALQQPTKKVTVAGKACESGDLLIKDIYLPPLQKNDLLAVFSTGAYCYSMASNYNRNPRPAVIFVNNGKARVVVRRESYDDLIGLDVL
ncbi:MAG: diaminopimelate decarboxylase [Firmicutes bacterium]|mgnify:CR=1 FL=1|nr:diaminopimelate decarboxylase [Bacillota bacterium]